MRDRIKILGIPIDAVSRVEARSIADSLLNEPRGHFVTTPNPEMCVLAHRDPEFRRIMNEADLAIPDGIGLLLVARAKGLPLPERISGVDFVEDLAALAVPRGAGLFLLGGSGDVAKRAADELKKRQPALRIVGAESGGRITQAKDGSWEMDPSLMGRLWAAGPTILLVALGHGKQEKWINDHIDQLPSLRLAIGVGGAFDFIAGDVSRAPQWMRNAGLEWLWRVLLQPWRLKRIWTAVVTFPVLAFFAKK